MTSETDYTVDESAMSTSTTVLDRASARLRRISVGAEAVHLRLTRGVTLTERVEAESGDPEDWSFLRRPALLGLLAVVSICVGASLPSSPFKQEIAGTWFFGEADWPSTTLMLPGVVAVYGGMILFVRVWYGLFQTLRARGGVPIRPLAYMLALWILPLLVVAPLFFIILLLSERAGGSEDIRDMGGIAFRAPVLASMFLIVALATLAMPGSSNFVGEFLILLGVFKAKLAIAVIAFSGVVMASVYALRLFIGAMHNRVGPKVKSRDITVRDGLVLVPLVAVILFLALYPQFALHRSEGSVKGAVLQAHFDTTRLRKDYATVEQLTAEGPVLVKGPIGAHK